MNTYLRFLQGISDEAPEGEKAPDLTQLLGSRGEELRQKYGTKWSCASCQSQLLLDQECVLVQICYGSAKPSGGHEYFPFLELEKGEYLFDPWRICTQCWGEIYDRMKEGSKELDSHHPDDREHRFVACACCAGNIRMGEKLGLVQYGEIRGTDRMPQGRVEHGFAVWADAAESKICLSCLILGGNGDPDLFEPCSEAGECGDCTHARCWHKKVECDCECHHEEEEDEEEDDSE